MTEKNGSRFQVLIRNNIFILVVVLTLMCFILSVATDYFATSANLSAILNQVISNGILAVGMTFVLLTGGIDLSVGSLVSFCGVSLASLMNFLNVPLGLALLLTLLIGIIAGLLNGLIVSIGKVPAFIATLGMQSIAAGAALTMAGGKSVTGFSMPLLMLMQTRTFDLVPVGFLVTLICFVIAFFVLRYTKFGRYLYIMGGNMETAKLAGINTRVFLIIPYVISGLCASIASIYVVGKLNSANPICGTGYELDAIAACVIGGVSLSGGEGSLAGTFLGVMIMGVIKNGLIQLGVKTYTQQIVIGLLIIAVVLFDMINRQRDNEN
jgi:ribose/xylose/arabinose/galactoside ABC-type transport system permease subunit